MSARIRNHTIAALAVAIALALTTTSVAAQQIDHSQHRMPPARTEQTKPTSDRDEKRNENASDSSHDHGNMRHDDNQGMDHGAMDHDSMNHDSMDHSAMGHARTAVDAPREPIPLLTDADRAAAFPDLTAHDHGQTIHSFFLLDKLEVFDADPGNGLAWEGMAWIGGDTDRIWLRSEGERSDGHTESADLEVLYGRSISPWWDVVAGVRHDFKPGASQSFAAFGVQGLAPQKFEVEATGYLGERGQTAARFEIEYELPFTGRLILQPMAEVALYGKTDPRRGVGSGLSSAEVGLRLRYEFTRKFAPYVGVVYERAFGTTADLRRDESERIDDTRIVVGLRTWF